MNTPLIWTETSPGVHEASRDGFEYKLSELDEPFQSSLIIRFEKDFFTEVGHTKALKRTCEGHASAISLAITKATEPLENKLVQYGHAIKIHIIGGCMDCKRNFPELDPNALRQNKENHAAH